jgi:hypothetical protein
VHKHKCKAVSFEILWSDIEILAMVTTLLLEIVLLHVQLCSIKIKFIALFHQLHYAHMLQLISMWVSQILKL